MKIEHIDILYSKSLCYYAIFIYVPTKTKALNMRSHTGVRIL